MHMSNVVAALIALVLPGLAFAQIHVTPASPGPGDSLHITVNSVAPGCPVEVLSTLHAVLPGVIRIDATLDVGPYSYPEPYTVNVTIPPVEPGTYEIQYWSTYIEGTTTTGPTLEWTASHIIHRAIPVPALSSGGLAALVIFMSIAGFILLRDSV